MIINYDELVKNVKDVLDEIPIHIYKNLIKGAYDRSEKYVKRPSTRKRVCLQYITYHISLSSNYDLYTYFFYFLKKVEHTF